MEGSSRVKKVGEGGRVEWGKDSRRRWKGRVDEGKEEEVGGSNRGREEGEETK